MSQGMVGEFGVPEGNDESQPTFQFQWLYVNGLLGVIFSMGVLYTSLASTEARSSLYGTGLLYRPIYTFDFTMVSTHQLLILQIIPAGWQRSLIADYGVPLMVILWTALSYSLPSKIPSGVPRRLFTPLPWEPKSLQHWTVAKVIRKCYYDSRIPLQFSERRIFFMAIPHVSMMNLQDLLSVPPAHIFLAIVPAAMVAGLYFFDHSVASQMAQQKEFNLKNPSAYHYDILVLSLTVCCVDL